MHLREVEIEPVYRVGEQSKMKVMKVMQVSRLLIEASSSACGAKYLFGTSIRSSSSTTTRSWRC